MGWTILLIWVISIIAVPVIAGVKKFGAGSILAFTLLTLIIGPFGGIVVLFANPSEPQNNSGVPPPIPTLGSLKDARQEILYIKRSINYLMKRLDFLEKRLNRMEGIPEPDRIVKPEVISPGLEVEAERPEVEKTAETPDVAEKTEIKAIKATEATTETGSQPKITEIDEKETLPDKSQIIRPSQISPQPARVSATVPQNAPEREGFEAVFGKVWLNRIGVVVFFLGMGFLLSYTFLFLSPLARIGLGYLVALGFFAWGRYLEKKEMYVVVARGIQGGAWGLLYLTTYATHFINATRIINESAITIFLLGIVSYAAVIYNLKYRNLVVTAITFILAFITAGLGGIEISTIAYFAILTGAIAYISLRLKWHDLLVFGICGTYLTSFWFIFLSYTLKDDAILRIKINLGMLTISWIVYFGALFLPDIDDKKKLDSVVGGILLNGMFFTAYGLIELYRMEAILKTETPLKIFFLAILGWLYLGAGYVFGLKKKEKLVPLNVLIAFTIFALAIIIGFPQVSKTYFLLLESVLIYAVGTIYREELYIKFSRVFNFIIIGRLLLIDLPNPNFWNILGIPVKLSALTFLFAATVFHIIEYTIKKRYPIRPERPLPSEADVYACCSFTFTAIAILLGFTSPAESYMLVLEMLTIFTLGIYLKDSLYRKYASIFSGLLMIKILAGNIIATPGYVPVMLIIFASVSFYIISLAMERKEIASILSEDEKAFYPYMVLYPTILLTFLISKEVPAAWHTSGWAILGIVILGLGFIMKRKIDRICGLCALTLSLMKLIFADMAGMNTIYRVVGFIMLGLILLGASMIYSKFMAKKD